MLAAYERHLIVSYLANAAARLHHRDRAASALAEWVIGGDDGSAFASKRLRSRLDRANIDPEENLSSGSWRSFRRALHDDGARRRGSRNRTSRRVGCRDWRKRRGSIDGPEPGRLLWRVRPGTKRRATLSQEPGPGRPSAMDSPLSRAGSGDEVLHAGAVDGSGDQPAPDHEGGRPADTQFLRRGPGLVEIVPHLRMAHVALQPFDVEARLAGELEDLLLRQFRLSHQGEMEGQVKALAVRSHRRLGGNARNRPKDRELLPDDAHVCIRLQQVLHRLQRELAIAALVIEELDHRDVSLGIAGDRRTASWEPAERDRNGPRRALPALCTPAPAGRALRARSPSPLHPTSAIVSTWSLVDTTQVSTSDRTASPGHTDPGWWPLPEAYRGEGHPLVGTVARMPDPWGLPAWWFLWTSLRLSTLVGEEPVGRKQVPQDVDPVGSCGLVELEHWLVQHARRILTIVG